jgi:outer membrane receptor protein involved in Fe transport
MAALSHLRTFAPLGYRESILMHLRALVLVLALFTTAAAAQTVTAITGVVLDPSGAPVPGASVRLDAAGTTVASSVTGQDGRFGFAAEPSGVLRVVATAPGFAQGAQLVGPLRGGLEITLQPAPFFEAVNVTSSRADVPRADPTATVTVLSSSQLLAGAAVTLDDALKMVPGFTLFRRTSSRTANPTTQGIALRGIGGTAQSRSLVIVDGVPLNDAFGGWVYWNKVPQAAIDRIEVQRGSGSDLYGADAVGGVVQLLTLRPTRTTGRLLAESGNLGTHRMSLFLGGRTRGWRYGAGGELFAIDGYIPIALEQDPGIAPRGPIDTKLGATHRSGLVSAGYQSAGGWRLDLAGSVFVENRKNATPASINSTASRQGSGEVAGGAAGGLLSVRLFGGTQRYRQVFTTVNANRTAEAVNRDQIIPSTSGGIGGQWFRGWGDHAFLAGAEGRYIDGTSVETPFTQGRALPTTEVGGRQRLGSAFVQDTVRVTDRLTLVVGAHGDVWQSRSLSTGFSKSSGAFNPRASGAYRLGESGVTVRGAVYQGFRAPTLNEFYRNFGSGNTQTRPNEALDPERLTGGDAGVLIARGRASARVTGFWNVLDEAITTITLSSTPQLILRQRANADTLRATGIEMEASVRFGSLSAAFTSGVVSSRFKGETPLRDKRVPQVPAYNIGLDLRYNRGRWTASTQLRVTGPQFEDDQNVFTLRRATVVDAFAGRTLAGRSTAFVAVENLFDNVYDVGRTPTLTTGVPRAIRAGVLVAFP